MVLNKWPNFMLLVDAFEFANKKKCHFIWLWWCFNLSSMFPDQIHQFRFFFVALFLVFGCNCWVLQVKIMFHPKFIAYIDVKCTSSISDLSGALRRVRHFYSFSFESLQSEFYGSKRTHYETLQFHFRCCSLFLFCRNTNWIHLADNVYRVRLCHVNVYT